MVITATVEKKETVTEQIELDLPYYSKSAYGAFLYRINKDKSVSCVFATDIYYSVSTQMPNASGYGREIMEATKGEPSTEKEFIDALEKVRAQMEKSMTA